LNFHQKMVCILVHSKMTFYVYAKTGQVNGGHPPSPLDPRYYISEMVEDRWVHAVRRLTSIEFSFEPCNIYCDGPRGVGYPADARSVGDSHLSCYIIHSTSMLLQLKASISVFCLGVLYSWRYLLLCILWFIVYMFICILFTC